MISALLVCLFSGDDSWSSMAGCEIRRSSSGEVRRPFTASWRGENVYFRQGDLEIAFSQTSLQIVDRKQKRGLTVENKVRDAQEDRNLHAALGSIFPLWPQHYGPARNETGFDVIRQILGAKASLYRYEETPKYASGKKMGWQIKYSLPKSPEATWIVSTLPGPHTLLFEFSKSESLGMYGPGTVPWRKFLHRRHLRELIGQNWILFHLFN
ncbi:MAG: hypothetical protein ABL994_13540 [Verrucomicrobiales bacterium]